MNISVELENGLLPDRFGKHAPAAYQLDGHPVRSFPIEIADVPAGARSLALTLLDWDAIPVGGFCWIHWIACNFPPDIALVPENASASGAVACVQGSNTDYTLTLYALDCELDLVEGYFLNEFRRAIEGHVLAEATLDLPSRA